MISYTNELGHMTNMAAMPIYGKNLKKSSSPDCVGEYYQICSNYDPGLTLTHFTPRSIWSHRLLYWKK